MVAAHGPTAAAPAGGAGRGQSSAAAHGRCGQTTAVIRGGASRNGGPAATARPAGSLRGHRDFRRLWAGETVSELGSQVSQLALPLVAVRALDATTFEIGLLEAASTVAFLLVGLPAGALVDRVRRRPVLVAADVGRMVAMGSVPVAYALGVLHLAQLYVVAVVTGVLSVFFDVAYQSHLPALVGREHVVEGNAKLAGSAQVAQVAGPSLAGALVQAIGGPYAVAVDAASFLWSSTAVGAIGAVEAPPGGRRGRLAGEIGEGLRFVLGDPVLRAIAATTATINLFGGLSSAVVVPFLVRVLAARPGVIGLLFAAGGAGGVLAAVVASRLARRLGGARATRLGSYLCVGNLLLPLARPGAGLLLFAAGLFVGGFGTVVYNVNQVSFRQRRCPAHLLGRMNATMRFVVWGVLPLGALAGGAIGSAIGLRPTLWISAVGSVAGVGFLLSSPLRTQREFPEIA